MQKSAQVLMFGWELPPYNTGGLGVACYGMAKGLSQLGVNISFALPRRLPTHVPFMGLLDHPLQGVQVTAINSLLQAYATPTQYRTNYNSSYYDHAPHYASNLYDEAWRFAKMAKTWAKTQPYNVIHAHDGRTYPTGVAAKKEKGAPLIAHVHATEFDRTGGHCDTRISEVEYQGLQAADKVIAVSHYTKDIVSKRYSVPSNKITVVHNGVDPVDFTARDVRRIFPHDKIVLFVGRLTYQKGVDYFLRAAQQVLAVHPDTIFIVVGDGDQFQKHILDAAYLNISHRVIFTGFLQGTPLRDLYAMADAFVMPSVSEPYGIVALEAIASGVPCIISKQSGVAETVKNVLTVDFWDVNRTAHLINTILSYPAIGNELKTAAAKELKNVSWHTAAEKINHLYQEVLN
jgi:glycogen synthase